MGIHVAWKNNNHTVLVWTFDGRWDWEMLCEASEQATELRRKLDYRKEIVTILDLTSASPVQTGQLMLSLPRPVEIVNQSYDTVVLAGREAFNQKMLATLRRLGVELGDSVVSVASLPEALHVASEHNAY